MRVVPKYAAALAATTAIVLTPAAACAAVDAFLQIGDIKGGATDDKHKDWIEVSSFSLGAPHASMGAATGAATERRVGGGEVTLQIPESRAGGELQQAVASGRHFPTAVLEMVRRGRVETERFEDVMVTSARMIGGGDRPGERPMESITFSYARVETQSASSSGDTHPAVRTSTAVRPLRPN